MNQSIFDLAPCLPQLYLRFQLTHSETAFSLSACVRPPRVLLRSSSKNLPVRHNKLYYALFCSLSRRLVEALIVNACEIIPFASKICDYFFPSAVVQMFPNKNRQLRCQVAIMLKNITICFSSFLQNAEGKSLVKRTKIFNIA